MPEYKIEFKNVKAKCLDTCNWWVNDQIFYIVTGFIRKRNPVESESGIVYKYDITQLAEGPYEYIDNTEFDTDDEKHLKPKHFILGNTLKPKKVSSVDSDTYKIHENTLHLNFELYEDDYDSTSESIRKFGDYFETPLWLPLFPIWLPFVMITGAFLIGKSRLLSLARGVNAFKAVNTLKHLKGVDFIGRWSVEIPLEDKQIKSQNGKHPKPPFTIKGNGGEYKVEFDLQIS